MNHIEKAIKVIQKELSNDSDYFNAWKANIAMAFYDEYRRRKYKKSYLNMKNIHACANVAADTFLKLLIRP